MKKEDLYSKHSKYDEENDFKEVPVAVICDLEKDELSGTEGVHCLEREVRGWPDPGWSQTHTERVNVAMSAQKKLLHKVLMLKFELISYEAWSAII
jgi:hypothetical protein